MPSIVAHAAATVSAVDICERISRDSDDNKYLRTCWSLVIQVSYSGFGQWRHVLVLAVLGLRKKCRRGLRGCADALMKPMSCGPLSVERSWARHV